MNHAMSPHERRMRRMLALGAGATALLEFGWSFYYGLRGQSSVAAWVLLAAASSSSSFFLVRGQHLRTAMYLLLLTTFVVIFVCTGVLDVPSERAPRAMHEFFLPVGVGACLVLRTEPRWISRGFPIACFAAFVYFAAVNPVWTTSYAVSDSERVVNVWVNHVGALLMLYLAVQVIQNEATQRTALELQLRDALLRDEFELHFQPQVDNAGLTIGAEALIRWRHPTRGLVFPNDFIFVAESSGVMVQIGDWVLRNACKQLAAWANDPLTAHMQLAVNVSASQFAEPGFERRVLEIVQGAGVPASQLKLELTESMLAHDLDEVIAKMTVLKEAGILLSLDDFGTGFSSLAYLRRLPFDQLKIDQAFVRSMQASSKDAAIVQAVLTLGESLGLQVIAEGVETQAHRHLLSKAGCELFQGYLFSRPIPATNFITWLRDAEAARIDAAAVTREPLACVEPEPSVNKPDLPAHPAHAGFIHTV